MKVIWPPMVVSSIKNDWVINVNNTDFLKMISPYLKSRKWRKKNDKPERTDSHWLPLEIKLGSAVGEDTLQNGGIIQVLSRQIVTRRSPSKEKIHFI